MTIIFIHKGLSWYLEYALKQAKKSNPNARIVLLGDSSNESMSNIVEYHNMRCYFNDVDGFAKIYTHYSTSPYGYELFNFQRWIIWRNFMRSEGILEAILPDTDTLFFEDVDLYFTTIKNQIDFTKGKSNYMGFMFTKLPVLESFVDYLFIEYSAEQKRIELKSIFEKWISGGNSGGVSDITLYELFENSDNFSVINTETKSINGCIFVHSLNSNLFITSRGGHVIFENNKGSFYAKDLNGNKLKVIALHCFGDQKLNILRLYKGEGQPKALLKYYWKVSLFHRLIVELRKNATYNPNY